MLFQSLHIGTKTTGLKCRRNATASACLGIPPRCYILKSSVSTLTLGHGLSRCSQNTRQGSVHNRTLGRDRSSVMVLITLDRSLPTSFGAITKHITRLGHGLSQESSSQKLPSARHRSAGGRSVAGRTDHITSHHTKDQFTKQKARQRTVLSSPSTFHATAWSKETCLPIPDMHTPDGR